MKTNEFITKNWAGIMAMLIIVSFFGYHFAFEDNSHSSFIQNAHYIPFSNSLVIKIQDKSFKYCDVPIQIWKKYKYSYSKGSFYNSVIKPNYGCAYTDVSKMVFDHTIPLSFGGGDFGTTSFSDFTKENYGVTKTIAATCFAKLVLEENQILTNAGYKRQSDGSWMDDSGGYPDPDLENDIEIGLSKKFQYCIR